MDDEESDYSEQKLEDNEAKIKEEAKSGDGNYLLFSSNKIGNEIFYRPGDPAISSI